MIIPAIMLIKIALILGENSNLEIKKDNTIAKSTINPTITLMQILVYGGLKN